MWFFSSAYFSESQWLKPVFSVNKPVPVAVSASFRFLATIRDPARVGDGGGDGTALTVP